MSEDPVFEEVGTCEEGPDGSLTYTLHADKPKKKPKPKK